MPGCVLRVIGPKSKIHEFVVQTKFELSSVWFKGQPGFIKSRGPSKTSGFNLPLTSEGLGFAKQTLDFGLYDLRSKERVWPMYRVSTGVITLAARYRFSLELSFYGPP